MTEPAELPARSLAAVLRRRLRRPPAELLIAKVTATPDSKHVTVSFNGSAVTVPRLASYTAPVVNEPCYLLAAGSLTIALGAVR